MLIRNEAYRILIVEDNPGDALLIEDLLFEKIKSLRTTISTSFKDAKKVLSGAECDFDVILLDLSLPDKAGHDLVAETINICNGIPIIILTGYADMEFGVKSLSLGAADYILKDELTAVNLYKSIIYCFERGKNINLLKESEKRYSDLFHSSPLPMWVYDWETLQFLDVNEAAIKHYGYSLGEFLSMTIKDIRPVEELIFLEKVLAQDFKSAVHKGIFRHKKKTGELINVDIESNPLLFNSKKARIVVATDVTETLNHIKIIENQNMKFMEIAWIQSHVVRAPLARILGFIALIKDKQIDTEELEKVLDYIALSANELDVIIKDISRKANEVTNLSK